MNLTQNILTTLSARILLLGVALVSSMALARTLGPEGRGLLALVLLLPELVKSFALLGFEQANAVYAGLEPAGRRALVWHSTMTALVVGGMASLASVYYIAAGAPGFQGLLRGPAWLYMVPIATIPARLLMEYWGAILRGMNRIFVLNLIEVGTRVVSLALILVCIVGLGTGVAGVVFVDAAVLAGAVLVMAATLASSGVLGRPTFNRLLWKRTARFAIPAYGGSVMGYLNYRIDQFIIAVLLAPEQLAFYVIAVDIAERLWIIPGAVATALLPHLTNMRDRNPAFTALVARHTVLWTGAGCFLVFAGAGVAVDLLFGEAYDATSSPLRWLLPGILTLTVGKVLVAELLAREKILFTSMLSVAAATINTTTNFLLIPRMGIVGAAVASSLSYSLISLIVAWYFVRVTGVPWADLAPRRSDLLAYGKLIRRFRGIPEIVAPAPKGATS